MIDAPGGLPRGVARTDAGSGLVVERRGPADLAEILERVLTTGIVIAGEIRIDLLDIELLTIKLRLVITSLDRAEEVGLDWWRSDPWYSSRDELGAGDAGDDDAADSGDDDGERGSGETSGDHGSGDGERGSDGDDRSQPRYLSPERPPTTAIGSPLDAEELVAESASLAEPTPRRQKQAARSDSTKKSASKKSASKKSASKKGS